MIGPADLALVDAARDTILARYREGWHVVGAALRTRSGAVFTGVHLEATVGRIAVCAEAVALGRAATEAGDTDVESIVAVYHPGAAADDAPPAVVAPCGMCREMIADYAPGARVIVAGRDGDLVAVPVEELIPRKFARPADPSPKRMPMRFDPEVLTLFEALKALDLPPVSRLSPAEARLIYRAAGERNGGPKPDMAEVRDVSAAGPAGPVPLRLYRPRGAAERDAPALVFFHGGGWVIGDLDSHDGVCRHIAQRAGCVVVAVDYRLAPEHPAPAAAEDCVAALRWIASHGAALGVDPSRLAVGGDSAGGSLSAAVTLAARDGGPALRAQILIYPSVDNRAAPPRYPSRDENRDVPPLTPDVLDWFTGHYLPDPALREDVRQSPMAAADKSRLPPALVIVAERDPLHAEGLAYADALEAAGVSVSRMDVPGMIHGFITMPAVLSAAGRAYDAIAAELKLRFG